MLITKEEEISAYLPTSVHNSAEALLVLTEDAEENYLVPILGRSLYDKVVELYNELLTSQDSVFPQSMPEGKDTPESKLVRLCQMPSIYFALANSTGLLSVSLNDGGGFNQVSTNGYESADEKAIGRFERDAFQKGRRGIDRLLIFLEEDARSKEPKFSKLWKESSYFYQQGDLLFTTAIEMNRFLNIGLNRENFISLLPDIRYCQDNYLVPAIGDELMDALVQSCTDSTLLPEGDAATKVWRKAIDFLRMSLGIYVESRRPEKQRRYSENEATLSLVRAKEYIAAHQDEFGEHIKNSPLYTPPKGTTGAGGVEEAPKFDNTDPKNAIFVFGGGINRH